MPVTAEPGRLEGALVSLRTTPRIIFFMRVHIKDRDSARRPWQVRRRRRMLIAMGLSSAYAERKQTEGKVHPKRSKKREAFSIGAPTQVGGGINGALGGLTKHIERTEGQDAVQQAAQRDGMYRQRRFPLRPPCSLVGIGEQRFAYLGEARTAVGAVFNGDAFYPKQTRTHGCALTAGARTPPLRGPCQSPFVLPPPW